jgi:biopolymer transport protein ExbB/TolQ
LLGLLGTVIALLGVAGDSGFENTQQNFLIALTSTLWGVVSAIIFKVLDALTSPQVDKYDNEVERKKVRYEDA